MISALPQMKRIENMERTKCSLEKARSNKMMAVTSNTKVSPMPNVKYASASPPASAPSPVAFEVERYLST